MAVSTDEEGTPRLEEQAPAKLPRGPHALPHDVVLAHQRERLLGAAAVAMAERGYGEVTVRQLIERAGVSRRTFYELFEDKLDCVAAAHERAFKRLSDAILAACAIKAEWPERASAGIGEALEFARWSPEEVQLVILSTYPVSEPKIAALGRDAQEKLAELLRTGRRASSEPGVAPELTEQGLIGAIMTIVGERLQAGDVDELDDLKPELIEMVLTPYVGAGRAHSVAAEASA